MSYKEVNCIGQEQLVEKINRLSELDWTLCELKTEISYGYTLRNTREKPFVTYVAKFMKFDEEDE